MGVDPTVLMAIYGHETSYGLVTGSIDLLQALASLGYYGRRRDFFESEFISALKLIDQGVPRWRLKGSWAGATGYPQFMPSVALRLRADGDGDGYRQHLERRARRACLDRHLPARRGLEAERHLGNSGAHARRLSIAPRSSRAPTAQRCPQVYRRHSRWLTMREWRALGVTPLGRSLAGQRDGDPDRARRARLRPPIC